MLYWVLKHIILFGLHCYHRKIRVYGLEDIPKNKPVLFLPNHQNALIDVLLIAVDCNRKPYFLARSDVFGRSVLDSLFKYVRMIPIYRIRDGRSTLSKNDAVFDTCARVLAQGEAIVMFPEGNHSLKRSVRPLSKGFTRVLFRAAELSPQLDIQIIPVGVNYSNAEKFPSSAAVYFGEPIPFQTLYDKEDLPGSAVRIRNVVAMRLKTLTTHISPEQDYAKNVSYLKAQKADFLDPENCNRLLKGKTVLAHPVKDESKAVINSFSIFQIIFMALNLPVILVWRLLIKPKVPEPEFMGTFRFVTMFGGFIMYSILLFVVVLIAINFWWAVGILCLLWIFNVGYVKYFAT
jgi:1-acyl-sn-glycerol-3-phosphate acyltransferase